MVEPVTVAELAAHLRLDGSSPFPDQSLLSAIITAARQGIEDYLGSTVVEQTRVLYCTEFDNYGGGQPLALPLGPVTSIASITYEDAAGAQQTLSTGVYELFSDAMRRADCARLKLNQQWPATSGRFQNIAATYTAAMATVPGAIKQALLLYAGEFYAHRELSIAGGLKPGPAVEFLLQPYRRNLGV